MFRRSYSLEIPTTNENPNQKINKFQLNNTLYAILTHDYVNHGGIVLTTLRGINLTRSSDDTDVALKMPDFNLNSSSLNVTLTSSSSKLHAKCLATLNQILHNSGLTQRTSITDTRRSYTKVVQQNVEQLT